jgi:hypothetical protein
VPIVPPALNGDEEVMDGELAAAEAAFVTEECTLGVIRVVLPL